MHAFRKLALADPVVIELREWSRVADDLTADKTRLANRVREQLWRDYPQLLAAEDDVAATWLLDLWSCADASEGRPRARGDGRPHLEEQPYQED